jgi:hypothetical protein
MGGVAVTCINPCYFHKVECRANKISVSLKITAEGLNVPLQDIISIK